MLGGLGIQKHHATVSLESEKCYIEPAHNKEVGIIYVNGNRVAAKTELFANDRIAIGLTCIFL